MCAGLSVAIGAFTLLGWFLGRPEWTSVVQSLPPMEPNTALMAIVAGISLVLVSPPNASRPRVVSGQVLAGAMLVFAVLPLIEHTFRVDIAVDRLLGQGESGFHSPAGRPSPQ